MDDLILPAWPTHLSETMRIGFALVVAGLVGEGLARFVRLPRVSGYSLAGLLLGPAVFGWFGVHDMASFRIVIDLALALLLFELGTRVDMQWFRTNPWIIPSSLAEAGLTFVATFAVLRLLGTTPGFAATVGAIAIGTSPTVVMRVATELRAEGQVTQRLFVFTALNVLYSVVLSKLIVGGMHGAFRNDWVAAVVHPMYLLFGSLLVGAMISAAFCLLRRCFELSDELAVAILFGMLLVTLSLLKIFALPTMLAPLLAGVMVKNSDRRPILWPRHFGTAGGVLIILLFVLTGAMLTGKDMAAGGLVALAVIAARVLGKGAGLAAFGTVGGLSYRQTFALGIALMPMSAVAFVLVDDICALYPEFGAQIGVVVLSMIAVLQLIGPIGVQWALRLSNETNERER
ncbi:MAG TPA: cation:proton antiporter [Burkholderiaceae bacterium]|jgi:Kef-type K+ transport system membrane component KefB|nr:cation:proton antiporter [Burkholderiaceae bacterium]